MDFDNDESFEADSSPLKALGLHRVGQLPRSKPSGSGLPLNSRGMPARIRKKNPMYFGEDHVVTSPGRSPRKVVGGRSPVAKAGGRSPVASPRKQHNAEIIKNPLLRLSSSKAFQNQGPSSFTPQSKTLPAATFSNSKRKLNLDIAPNKSSLSLSSSALSSGALNSSSGLNSSMLSSGSYQSLPDVPLEDSLDIERGVLSDDSYTTSDESEDDSKLYQDKTLSPDKIYDFATISANAGRLRNFLKLPQAHKWIYYEWFYANIDQPLFMGRNDFGQILNESFPLLKSSRMSRRQWGIMRRLMGKPRRCSSAFFSEERASLDKRREVLRLLQQRKITDVKHLKDLPFNLPPYIPCQLVVGTKVTARIRSPENGLFVGHIDAVDTSNRSYRVAFAKVGTRAVRDHDVLSYDTPEVMPLESFHNKFRPRAVLVTPPRPPPPKLLDSPLSNDPILAQPPRQTSFSQQQALGETIGDYKVSSLMHIVRLYKLLDTKSSNLEELGTLNTGAERLLCTGEQVSAPFQRRYANLVLDMDSLNDQLNAELLRVHSFCQEICSSTGMLAAAPTLLPRQISERCMAEAMAVVQVSNKSTPEPVTVETDLQLVTSLTALMLHLKNMGEQEVSAFEVQALQSSLAKVREQVQDKEAFRDLIEVPITHIMASASQMGPLNAFSETVGL